METRPSKPEVRGLKELEAQLLLIGKTGNTGHLQDIPPQH
jgi:hypothetical protein